jgi:peroxiredoxin
MRTCQPRSWGPRHLLASLLLLGSLATISAGAAETAPPAAIPAAPEAPASPIAPEAPASPTLGVAAPNFSLVDLDGKRHSLTDFRGRTLVLEWINLDCPFVKNHYDSTGNLPALQRKAREEGTAWLTICSSAPGKQGHFDEKILRQRLAANGWAADAYLVDADGAVGRRYAAKTTPHLFVIDAAGRLLYDGAIDSEPGTRPESIAKARNHVAPILQALQAEEEVEPRRTKPYGCSVKY